jgi:DNA-binding response OmpR family regulator
MRIAVIDDDSAQVDLVRQVLESAGHTVQGYSNGSKFLREQHRDSFDLIVLDWHLPDIEGPDLMRRLREDRRVPVLFVTARADESDIVTALDAGADDYMIKPLRSAELLARVSALLRRTYNGTLRDQRIFSYGSYVFDTGSQSLCVSGEAVTLTQKEFELALLLFRNLGRPLSRAHIMDQVWGRGDDIPTRTMDTHISRIRTRLHLRPEHGFRLSPLYGYGYRLERVEEFATAPAPG